MRHILVEPVRDGLEVFGRRSVAGLELAQGQHVDLAGDAIVVVATFDAEQVAFPAILVGRADAAVTVLAVIALDDLGMYV